MECRALLIEYRALLIERRALLMKCRTLYKDLLIVGRGTVFKHTFHACEPVKRGFMV